MKNKLKNKDLAQKLGVTKGYISQILNGNFDHKLSKLIELSLACDKIPYISYLDLEKYIKDDYANDVDTYNSPSKPVQYIIKVNSGQKFFVDKKSAKLFEQLISNYETENVNVEVEPTTTAVF